MKLLPRVEKHSTVLTYVQVARVNIGNGTTVHVVVSKRLQQYQYHALPLDNYNEPSGILYQQKMRKRYGSVLQLRQRTTP